jgi:hypothetical protein
MSIGYDKPWKLLLLRQLNIAHLGAHFCVPLCRKALPNLRVRLRFAPRLTKNSLKI